MRVLRREKACGFFVFPFHLRSRMVRGNWYVSIPSGANLFHRVTAPLGDGPTVSFAAVIHGSFDKPFCAKALAYAAPPILGAPHTANIGGSIPRYPRDEPGEA